MRKQSPTAPLSFLATAALLSCLGALGAVGCDDPPLNEDSLSLDGLSGLSDTGAAQDSGETTVDATNMDIEDLDATSSQLDAVQDAESADGQQQSSDGESGDGEDQDAGWTLFDVPKPDVPALPLEVLSTSPKEGAEGVDPLLTIEITFSAELLDASVADYTVFVRGPGGEIIAGDLATSGTKLTFKSKAKVPAASPVTVELNTLVQSVKGDALAAPFSLHFYTGGYPKTETMAALAARYAPVLLQDVGEKNKGLDYLRSPNFDMDWNGSNNMTHLSKFDALARVGWAVSYTHSHFFIHYAMYWPQRVATTPDLSFDNDVAGATVVVARWPKETPVALLTWFKHLYDEQMWAWATQEGGLLPPGKSTKSANLRGLRPLDKLFAPSPFDKDNFGCEGIKGCVPRRYLGLLTAGSHQSCLWSEIGDQLYDQCRTDTQAKSKMKLIRYRPGPVATKASGAGAAVGQEPPTFVYELVPLFERWFPHREEAGKEGMFAGPVSWIYKPPAGRPKGPKTPLATQFISVGQADFGRPPWAWQWKPGTNTSYYSMPLGTPFFDPAWALYQRLGGKAGGVLGWDPAKKTGLSATYCFAAFLGIDARDGAACKDALPSP